MTTKIQIKKMTTFLKSKYDLDFDRLPFQRLKDEIQKAYKDSDFTRSYRLDVASDIKDLLGDQNLNHEDRTFYIDVLLEQFFSSLN